MLCSSIFLHKLPQVHLQFMHQHLSDSKDLLLLFPGHFLNFLRPYINFLNFLHPADINSPLPRDIKEPTLWFQYSPYISHNSLHLKHCYLDVLKACLHFKGSRKMEAPRRWLTLVMTTSPRRMIHQRPKEDRDEADAEAEADGKGPFGSGDSGPIPYSEEETETLAHVWWVDPTQDAATGINQKMETLRERIERCYTVIHLKGKVFQDSEKLRSKSIIGNGSNFTN